MRCIFCNTEDMSTVVLVPVWLPDGSLSAFACLDCSKKEGRYCERHERPHIGFEDKTTACIMCIEELIEQEKHRAGEVSREIKNSLDSKENEKLREAAQVSAALTGGSENLAILRFVASVAKRWDITLDNVIEEVKSVRSTELILGNLGKW